MHLDQTALISAGALTRPLYFRFDGLFSIVVTAMSGSHRVAAPSDRCAQGA